MKCTQCKKYISDELKYLAYYSNGKPVYWKKCESCIKKSWDDYKGTTKQNTASEVK